MSIVALTACNQPGGSPSSTAEVDARITLNRSTTATTTATTIGERIEIDFDVFPPAGHRPAPLEPLLNPDLTVSQRSRLQKLPNLPDSRTHYTQNFTLIPFDTGEFPIVITNAITATSTNGTTTSLSLDTNLSITVNSVLTDTDLALIPETETAIRTNDVLFGERDIHLRKTLRGEAAPPPPAPPWAILAAAVAAVLIGLLISFVLLRRYAKPVFRPEPPPIPAHITAIEQLDALHEKPYLDHGDAEPFFTELSVILRTYLEGQLHLRAPDQTTEEFLRDLETTPHLNADQKETLTHFSNQADLIKFAKATSDPTRMEDAWTTARKLVEQTRHIDITEEAGETEKEEEPVQTEQPKDQP